MRFDVVTLFPEIFSAVRDCGITARARMRGLWSINCWNPRDTATDLHRTIDDRPFGGGPGMVMMAEPLAQTIDAVRASGNCGRVLSFAPNGARLTDARVREIAAAKEPIVLVCGRYEGIDERFLESYVDEVVSLGDFVLSGGELPACALIDAVVRQLPGAIKDLSASDESFATGCAALHASRGLAGYAGAGCAFVRPSQKHRKVVERKKFGAYVAYASGSH